MNCLFTRFIIIIIKKATTICGLWCVTDGFDGFRATYPEWCESCSDVTSALPDQVPLMGLRSLRISAYLPSAKPDSAELPESERCDSSLGLEDDRDFPVEILPHLFLGNAANSEDIESLSKHGIKV